MTHILQVDKIHFFYSFLVAIAISVTGLLSQEDHSVNDAYVQQQIQQILERNWQHGMISAGDNFPTIGLERERRGELLILLSKQIPPESIRKYFQWTTSELNDKLKELEHAGVLERDESGTYLPTVAIITLGSAARHMPLHDSLIEQTSKLIIDRLPDVKRKYSSIEAFSNIPFEHSSLLILSDVLLDNWQINHVEEVFLEAERPLRAGSRYYYSIHENNPWSDKETFYGNMFRNYGSYSVGIYGNRRIANPKNFIIMDKEGSKNIFGIQTDSIADFKQSAISHLFTLSQDSDHVIPAQFKQGFEKLGWIQENQLAIPILDQNGLDSLSEMAGIISDDLLDLLNSYRPTLEAAYHESPFGRQITFEEYFMWWFHYYYTAVTDDLISKGYITAPVDGFTSYLYPRN